MQLRVLWEEIMNNLFSIIFSYVLEIAHYIFIFLLAIWFFGNGSENIDLLDKIFISAVIIIFYSLFMGTLSTIVSIREHLEEINDKITHNHDDIR